MKEIEPGQLWSAQQCEEFTSIPESTWRYWAQTGAGPWSFKLGKRRFWRKDVVIAWINEQEAAALRGGAA